MLANPTQRTYSSLTAAFDFFNHELFGDELPPCLITMQRHKGAYGYFSGERFMNVADHQDFTDEIALNPAHFATRSPEQVLATLAHEMVHLWQHHFGKPPRKAYHDRQWASKMRQVGLIPSDTGEPGGKETGQKMTHYIEEGGPFARACAKLLDQQPAMRYHDRASEDSGARRKKAASKTKYTCPGCDLNAWAKPGARLMCADCSELMQAEAQADQGDD